MKGYPDEKLNEASDQNRKMKKGWLRENAAVATLLWIFGGGGRRRILREREQRGGT